MTPNVYRNDDTLHSTNTKGLRTGYKNDHSPIPGFTSSLKTDHSPYLVKRYERDIQEENQMNDSLNDRIVSPDRAYDDGHKYTTPINQHRKYQNRVSISLVSF